MLTFVIGMKGGSDRKGMPSDFFLKVMEVVMPCWDLLRRNLGDDTQTQNQRHTKGQDRS